MTLDQSAYRCIVADPPWLPTMALINSPAFLFNR